MSTQLTLSEVAKILNVSEKSIRRYIKAGRMRANLIKGQKGYEYRIDKNQVNVLKKPPRGKNSHKTVSKNSNKKSVKKTVEPKKYQENKKVKSQKIKKASIKKDSTGPIESVGEILKKKIIEKNIEQGSIDYKTLYENLLVRYEQTLIMLGALEAQASNRTTPTNNAKIEKMEDVLAKQEEIILDLYQELQLYKKTNNEF